MLLHLPLLLLLGTMRALGKCICVMFSSSLPYQRAVLVVVIEAEAIYDITA